MYVFFFFFKQKTAYEIDVCDWSSDVCSSDLEKLGTRSSSAGGEVSAAATGEHDSEDR